jgi:hypothetical protein
LTRLKYLSIPHNQRILDAVTAKLNVLKIKISPDDVLDLKKFVVLKKLGIDNEVNYLNSNCPPDVHPLIEFPSRVEEIKTSSYFDFVRSRVIVDRLVLRNDKECNFEFISHCFSDLRMFRLHFCYRDDPNFKNYLSTRVFSERRSKLFSMYVPLEYKELEDRVRERCKNLLVFAIERKSTEKFWHCMKD